MNNITPNNTKDGTPKKSDNYSKYRIRNDDEKTPLNNPKYRKTNKTPISDTLETPMCSKDDNKKKTKKHQSKSVKIKDKSNNFNEKNVQINEYEKDYSEEKFWDKIKKYAIKIGVKPIYIALLLFYALPNTSILDKTIIIGALGYLISPLDIIPDCIPVVGFMDDISILLLAFKTIKENVNDEVKEKARNKFKSIFGKYTDKQIDELID